MKYMMILVAAMLSFNIGYSQVETNVDEVEETVEAKGTVADQNATIIAKLQKAGDNISKPRRIEYWLYFKTEEGRTAFIEYAAEHKYRVENTGELKNDPYPHALKITRVSDAQLKTINAITKELQAEARKEDGDFDGWGCEMAR